jgi:hypothetical protein
MRPRPRILARPPCPGACNHDMTIPRCAPKEEGAESSALERSGAASARHARALLAQTMSAIAPHNATLLALFLHLGAET